MASKDRAPRHTPRRNKDTRTRTVRERARSTPIPMPISLSWPPRLDRLSREVRRYRYFDEKTNGLDFDGLMADLEVRVLPSTSCLFGLPPRPHTHTPHSEHTCALLVRPRDLGPPRDLPRSSGRTTLLHFCGPQQQPNVRARSLGRRRSRARHPANAAAHTPSSPPPPSPTAAPAVSCRGVFGLSRSRVAATSRGRARRLDAAAARVRAQPDGRRPDARAVGGHLGACGAPQAHRLLRLRVPGSHRSVD